MISLGYQYRKPRRYVQTTATRAPRADDITSTSTLHLARIMTNRPVARRLARDRASELIASTLRAKWLGAPPAAISLGLCIVLEKADADHEISYQRAVRMVTRAACTAILRRPRSERNLTATLHHILVAARRERHAA